MSDHPHAFLIDMLAMQDTAAAFGCGLEPRLLDLLTNCHATVAGTPALGHRIRTDGPAQAAAFGVTRIGRAAQECEWLTHARS